MVNDLETAVNSTTWSSRTPWRAKYVLTGQDLHALLGLDRDVRVVTTYSVADPDSIHIIVEGPATPPAGMNREYAALAWRGLVEAPILPAPVPL